MPGRRGLGLQQRCGGRCHPRVWTLAGRRCQCVVRRALRGLAPWGPWDSLHLCRDGQSPVSRGPSTVLSPSGSWPLGRWCRSVSEGVRGQCMDSKVCSRDSCLFCGQDGCLLGAPRVRPFLTVAFRRLLGPAPGVPHGVTPWWAAWWCGQRTCVARGPCLRVSLRVACSRWCTARLVGYWLRLLCGQYASRSSRGRLVAHPAQGLGQYWRLFLWHRGLGPVALRHFWCIGVRGRGTRWRRG